MLRSFKIRIALWYAGIFTIIITATLFTTYKIISYQLINDIKTDLRTKTKFVSQTLAGEHLGIGEHSGDRGKHSGNEHEEHENNGGESKLSSLLNSDFNDVQKYTELTNHNYALFIFSGTNLMYITPKYERLIRHISKSKFSIEQFYEINIEGIPFSISTINNTNYAIYIGYDLSAVKNLQHRLLNIFMIVFPLSLLLSVMCGFIVTQKTMKVIEQIDATAKDITSSNLSKRIELPKSEDEISRLITTLNSMIDRLEKSFTQAKQFSQDAAHEIRTPLTIIRGEIEELVVNEQGKRETVNALVNVLEEVQYLSSISERLLMIHNMDTDNIKYHFEIINLSELVKEICLDVQVLSMGKNIKVKMQADDNITINGNKELLSRLLWNISDNAIKYNKPNGSVWIKLFREGSQVNIQVRDSGIGIPESETSKIFNRFYRVDKSRSRHLGGSGLGLSICKWITDLHSGKIIVESKEQIGSMFTIKIASL